MADLMPGFKWQYIRCKKHGRVARYQYQPYSLSNPIIGFMECGCHAHPRDNMVVFIDERQFNDAVGEATGEQGGVGEGAL